tara:strand:- start:259 stop:411 length:153 start_codon:yes stop_codon:yes gene_type:complete
LIIFPPINDIEPPIVPPMTIPTGPPIIPTPTPNVVTNPYIARFFVLDSLA